MKKIIMLVCLAAMTTALGKEKANYDSYTGFTCDPTPVLPENETHPSLWFKEADVAKLRALKNQDALAAGLWKQLAESPFLTMELLKVPAASDDNKVVHTYYGSMSQIAKYAGFMAWMTDDPELRARYVERATKALERAYDGPIRSLDPKEQSGPVDEIYMGTWLQNYAAAYDWVQPFLTPQADQAIRANLAAEAERVATNLYNWANSPHNHLSKPAWGVGSMALALSSEPKACGWLGAALKAANENTHYFFSSDGIYREGSHYMTFSWINFVPFMVHYLNVSGVNQFKEYQPLMEWGVAARNNKGWLPNIEDAYIRPFPGHMTAAAYRKSSTWLHSSSPLSEVLMWGYKTTDMSPFDASVTAGGYNYTGASMDYALPLDEYLTYDPMIKSTAPDGSPTVFLKGGQTMFRNTWTSGDPAARYLLFQGVAEADNHQHAEHLSFILFAENQMMASDAGYSRGSYTDDSRKTWYNKAVAHNVITLNGAPPQDVKESVTPASRYRMDTTFFDFEEKDAPYPNGGLLRRAVAFPGESYFVVADIVTSPVTASAALLLHGGRGAISGANEYRLWNYSKDDYGPAAQLHTWTFGSDPALSIKDDTGEITYLKGDYGIFPYITAKASGKELVFLQVLFPSKTEKGVPAVSSVREGSQVWATVAGADAIDLFMIQPRSEKAVFQGLETDATFFWIRTDAKGVWQLAVREATFVRRNGKVLFQSSEPRSGTLDLRASAAFVDSRN
ncbi:MAG: heparinase II/III family protein [Kiritimatiellales bacterium]